MLKRNKEGEKKIREKRRKNLNISHFYWSFSSDSVAVKRLMLPLHNSQVKKYLEVHAIHCLLRALFVNRTLPKMHNTPLRPPSWTPLSIFYIYFLYILFFSSLVGYSEQSPVHAKSLVCGQSAFAAGLSCGLFPSSQRCFAFQATLLHCCT